MGRRAQVPVLVAALLAIARAAGAQVQTAKLVASDASAADTFGQDVALDGGWALIGAPQDDDVADQSGAAYLFRTLGASWSEAQKLKASDAEFGGAFGWSVALDGDVAVVGAPHQTAQGVFDAGAVYVFERASTTWSETHVLIASDGSSGDHFGFDVALRGTRLVVGAKDDDQFGPSAGSAYVFELVNGAWIEAAKLSANDAAPGDGFGRAVDIDGDVALVGAPSANLSPGSDHGAAYVFELGAAWMQAAKLVANDAAASDFFGFALALDGTRALVGASAHDHAATNAGTVYAFELAAGNWQETAELTAPDAAAGDQFGVALDLAGDFAIAGANADDDAGFSAGSAYVLRRSGNTWSAPLKLLALDGRDGDVFGVRAELNGNSALVAAVFSDDACPFDNACDSGAAYVLEFVAQATQYGSCAAFAPCGNADTHGGCANSTGAGAVLAAAGSSSVASDDLLLHASSLPPGVAGIAFVGGAATQALLGDGLRVVTGGASGIARLGVVQANSLGVLTHGPGVVAQTAALPVAAHIQPGATRFFQVWYRDPPGPCGGTTNLSNGVRVDFTP